jgi:hypothetical protein
MTKPRKRRTDPVCCGERRFSDEPEARAAAMVSLEERPGQERLFVYLCQHCDGWHLTRKHNGRRYMVVVDARVLH